MKKMGKFLIKCGLILILFMAVGFSVLAEESLSLNAVPSSGKAPLKVSFDLVSSEEIISVSWDFESDGIEDSIELSPKHTYAAGKYTVSANVTTANSSVVVFTTVNVDEPFSISVVATPSSGIAPLNVKFTTSVFGISDLDNKKLTYTWDFDNDGSVDSVEQNPTYVFEKVGNISVSLAVQDEQERKITKKIPITVSAYDSKVNVVSYFPTFLQLKENQVTFLVTNEGIDIIKDISAKIIGEGIQHLSSTTISRLKPGEQDSLTVKLNVLKEGEVAASIKIDERIFLVTFAVTEQVKVNKEELELKLKELKQKLQEQEDLYYEKKADNYIVAEIFENIKATKKQLQEAQQQILTNRPEEAKVTIVLAEPIIEDIIYRLQDAKKPKQTVLLWMKDNAIAITAIIAAIGTLSGLVVKVTAGAKKLGGDVKIKFTKKEEKFKQNTSKLDHDDEEKNDEDKNDDENEEKEEQPDNAKEKS